MSLVQNAMVAFKEYWDANANNSELFEADNGGRPEIRNGQTAMEMLFNYIEERRPMLSRSDFELLEIEKPFAVPLDPDDDRLIYIGRLDKVFRYQKRIYIGEHKTTTLYKRDGPFQSAFVDSFSPNTQVDGYLYAAYHTYGKEFKAVWIDAALVHKDVHDGFRFIPIERQFAQIDTWLWEARYWIAQIEANKDAYNAINDRNTDYLAAFPKNTVSCTQYGGCPNLDLCKMWANPDVHALPHGFRLERWEPFDELKLAEIKQPALLNRPINPLGDNIYDNTRVQEFRTCPRKFYYRHIRDWTPGDDRRPLLFGGSWHAAMDVVWDVLCDRRHRVSTSGKLGSGPVAPAKRAIAKKA